MSGSNRSERFALIAIVITCFLLVLSYQFGRDTGLLETEPHEHSNAYTDRTDKESKGICLTKSTVISAIDCMTNQKNQNHKANDEHRASHDLTAQRSMARYAWWMIIITFGTLLTTGAGIYYLRNTLIETRKIGQAQSRAYVAISEFKVSVSSAKIHIVCEIGNLGQTPSRKTEIRVHLVEKGDKSLPEKVLAIGNIFPNTPFYFEISDSNEEINIADIISGQTKLQINSLLDYEDVFGNSWHTKQTTNLVRNDNGGWGFSTSIDGNEAT